MWTIKQIRKLYRISPETTSFFIICLLKAGLWEYKWSILEALQPSWKSLNGITSSLYTPFIKQTVQHILFLSKLIFASPFWEVIRNSHSSPSWPSKAVTNYSICNYTLDKQTEITIRRETDVVAFFINVWTILSFNVFKKRFQIPQQLKKKVRNKTTIKFINSTTWDYIPLGIRIIAAQTERNYKSYLTFWTTYYQAKLSTNGSTGDLIVVSCQNSSRSCKITFSEKTIKVILVTIYSQNHCFPSLKHLLFPCSLSWCCLQITSMLLFAYRGVALLPV